MSMLNKPELDPNSKITDVIKRICESIDGKLLIILCVAYFVLFINPEFAVNAFGSRGFLISTGGSRLVFIIMPVLLLTEYFWFSLNNGNKYLTSIILMSTALIPIINIFK